MTRSLMVDSGAFSVWTQGAEINLLDYIRFCKKYSDASYFVNLDVIPGKPNVARSLTPEAYHEACTAGYWNCMEMVEHLPKEQVIPVYHEGDPIQWLGVYLDKGFEYIGISPANDSTTAQKKEWLRKVARYMSGCGLNEGHVKTHGFAVTAFALLKCFPWYSVDSASWKMTASWGGIYVPIWRDEVGWKYDLPPLLVAVSPMSPSIQKRQAHATTMSPYLQDRVRHWLAEQGIPYGVSEIVDGDKPNQFEGELWYDRKKKKILRPIVTGVSNSFIWRCIACATFMKKVGDAHKILMYFAGNPLPYDLEYQLGNRLLSYHYIRQNDYNAKVIQRHLRSM